MAYIAKRNKAYSGDDFFICDFNGVDWLTNTFFAEPDTTPPRITKETGWRDVGDNKKALLGNVFDPKEHTLKLEAGKLTEETATLSGQDKSNYVQRRYFDYFTARYPGVKFKTGDKRPYEPISVHAGDKLVGVIMPLTS